MAISCAKCGRQYDVTLFQYGRTINCACGERVGFEHKINLPKNEEIKFFADVMAARLVKWLRAVGFDTAWEDAIADAELVKRAIKENRFILTLDKKLTRHWRADNILLLESEDVFEQFCQTIEHFKIKQPKKFFTRCLVCNTFLKKIAAEEIHGDLPPNVRENQAAFHSCPNCGKVFWEGSHTRRMRVKIQDLFDRK